MRIALLAAGVAAALLVLHRLALAAERRGDVHYTKAGSSGSLGTALLEVQAILEPAKRHVVEQRKRDEADPQEEGGPPSAGGPERHGG